jgi:hypothetical protein
MLNKTKKVIINLAALALPTQFDDRFVLKYGPPPPTTKDIASGILVSLVNFVSSNLVWVFSLTLTFVLALYLGLTLGSRSRKK